MERMRPAGKDHAFLTGFPLPSLATPPGRFCSKLCVHRLPLPLEAAAQAGAPFACATRMGLPSSILSFVCRCAACALLAACQPHLRTPDPHGEVDGDPQRGQRLMAHYQCSACHVIPEVRGPSGGMGPPLTAFGERSYIAGHIPNDPALLRAWLRHPRALVPSTAMPELGVSEVDARDMSAYLLSLR